MKLFLNSQREALIKNHRINEDRTANYDPFPVVKLFTPDANAAWLLTELDPSDNVLFGLCDLGLGFAELGSVSLDEIEAFRGPFGLPIERDRFFEANRPLSHYAVDAAKLGYIPA